MIKIQTETKQDNKPDDMGYEPDVELLEYEYIRINVYIIQDMITQIKYHEHTIEQDINDKNINEDIEKDFNDLINMLRTWIKPFCNLFDMMQLLHYNKILYEHNTIEYIKDISETFKEFTDRLKTELLRDIDDIKQNYGYLLTNKELNSFDTIVDNLDYAVKYYENIIDY